MCDENWEEELRWILNGGEERGAGRRRRDTTCHLFHKIKSEMEAGKGDVIKTMKC